MYVKKLIIKKVIDLFTEYPNTRDDRWLTIRTITEQLRQENPDFNDWAIIQYAFDVDRAFRYVQQHVPSLRGKSWLDRQFQSGEIKRDEYENRLESEQYIKDIIQEYYQGELF
jgi:hypothetical protein